MATSFCGTPEYLAPEMVAHAGHDKTVDWWALGVLIYEMLIGVTPFYNRNRNMLLMKIKNSRIIFPDKTRYKIEYSDEVVDLISKLLAKERSTRLGTKGDAKEILSHPFFKSLDIKKLQDKMMVPPFKPDLGEGIDTKYFSQKAQESSLAATVIPEAKVKKVERNQDAFKDFDSKPGKKGK